MGRMKILKYWKILEEMKKLWKIMQWTPESVQSIEKINNLKVKKNVQILKSKILKRKITKKILNN